MKERPGSSQAPALMVAPDFYQPRIVQIIGGLMLTPVAAFFLRPKMFVSLAGTIGKGALGAPFVWVLGFAVIAMVVPASAWTIVWASRRAHARRFNAATIERLASTAEWSDDRGRRCRLTKVGLVREKDVIVAASEGPDSLYAEVRGTAARLTVHFMVAGPGEGTDGLATHGRTIVVRLPPGAAGIAAGQALMQDGRVRDYTAGRLLA